MADVVIPRGTQTAPKPRAPRERITFPQAPAVIMAEGAEAAAPKPKPRRRKGGGGKGKGGKDFMSRIHLRRKAGVVIGFYGAGKFVGGKTIMGVPMAVAASIGVSYFAEGNEDAQAVSDGAIAYGALEFMMVGELEKNGIKAVADYLEPFLVSLESKGSAQKSTANAIRTFLRTGIAPVSTSPAGAPVNPADLPAAAEGDARIEKLLNRHEDGG